jgi:hypothetical protein
MKDFFVSNKMSYLMKDFIKRDIGLPVYFETKRIKGLYLFVDYHRQIIKYTEHDLWTIREAVQAVPGEPYISDDRIIFPRRNGLGQ